MRFFGLITLLISSLLAIAVRAADQKPVSFHNDIRPIFNASCNACHKPEKLKGELDMTSFASLLKGGKHGSTVVAGEPGKSKLVEMISGDEPDMPPDGDHLKKEQVELIERWIKEGAKDDTPAPGTSKVEPPVYVAPPVISAMAFSPDGSVLAVSGYHEVLLHKPDGSGLVGRLVGEAARIESIVFTNDGKILGIAGGSPAEFGQIQLWDPAAQKMIRTFQLTQDSLYGLSFDPEGKTLAFGAADKAVRRLNVADGKQLFEFRAHSDWVLATIFTLDGKRLVSAGRDRALKYIDLENQRFIDDINNPVEIPLSFARNPKQEQVAYGGDLGTPRLYKISDNQGRTAGRNDTNLVMAFERQPAAVTSIAFSPDGSRLACGSVGEVRVYDVKDGKRVLTLSGQQGSIHAIAYSPDGSRIATGGFDGQVRLFDAKSGNLVKQFVPVPITAPTTTASKN
jgi:WD40 repeat protein/mono/diheme cytochrome c family protein